MKNKQVLSVLIIVVGICSIACTTFTASGIQMNVDTRGMEVLGNFSTSVTVNKVLGVSAGTNLFNISSDITNGLIRNAVEKEIAKMGGTAAINITVKYSANFIHRILNNLTVRIWAPAKIKISGTVIRQN